MTVYRCHRCLSNNAESYKTFLACRGLENSVCPFERQIGTPPTAAGFDEYERLYCCFFSYSKIQTNIKSLTLTGLTQGAVSSLHMASAHTNTLTPQVAKWSH